MSKRIASVIVAFLALTASPASAEDHELPDTLLVPGVDNPAVTQENIRETICVSGWTKTIRPPASYTNALKKQQLADWSYSDTNMKDFEEDHLVPLEVGGHPTDPQNLWPEPYGVTWGATAKDKLENFAKREVCSNKMTLDEGRALFKVNWIEAFKKYCGETPAAVCAGRR
jgi:hypothetical protein